MVGCCALNCRSNSRNGVRFFGFPKDPERSKRWLINCRRDKWKPEPNRSKLCEIHFEENQFEQNRQDGKKLLKNSAVPTLFDVPNPPKKLIPARQPPKIRKPPDLPKSVPSKKITKPKETSEIEKLKVENSGLLKKLIETEKREMELREDLAKFLREDQLKALRTSKGLDWSEETIQDALQIRDVGGEKTYELLKKLGYPLPSIRTLRRRINSPDSSPGTVKQITSDVSVIYEAPDSVNTLDYICFEHNYTQLFY